MIEKQIQTVVRQFLPDVEITHPEKLKGGIINRTYLIETETKKKYILQQINQSVFPDVPTLMNNLDLITNHLHKKAVKNKPLFPFYTYQYYKTSSGKSFFLDDEKTYWRLSDYIEHTNHVDTNNPQTVKEAGKLFGFFNRQLRDIDLAKIHEIIPGFHDSEKYYRKFLSSAEKDVAGRLSETENIYEKFIKYNYLIDEFKQIKNNQNIPLRLVHNDTKVDNILFNEKGQAICVIDLDTCMPGYLMTDFGDAIRSLSNTAVEDEPDLTKVSFDFSLYRNFANGFLWSVPSFILPEEKQKLAFFALLLTYEQALRFYTDYLNGDTYYHIDYATHNLQRTKVQLKLLEEMIERYEEMKNFVKNCF